MAARTFRLICSFFEYSVVTLSFQPIGMPAVPSAITFSPMQSGDEPRVNALHERVFGPGRFARTAFRLREKAAPFLSLSLVAEEAGTLIGAVSMSRIAVGDTNGVLLGPLAVLPEKRDVGVGKALLFQAVEAAHRSGEPFVLLVGDLPYYAPAGFEVVPLGTMTMPGPVDPSRLLIAMSSSANALPAGVVRGSA
ncbi:MAG: N-acetyltransferase [Hyphomicrobiales bacterium]|jgi:predicted N-acetyltransferase YhbS